MQTYLTIATHPLLWVFVGLLVGFYLILWTAGLKVSPGYSPTHWLRRNYWKVILTSVGILAVLALTFYLVEIGVSVATLVDRLEDAATDPVTPAVDLRNIAYAVAVLVGVLAAATTVFFSSIRVWINERTATAAEEALFNDKINAAAADLYATRQKSRKVIDPQAGLVLRDMWEDDVVRRCAAIDRLEGLVTERPEVAGRVSRMLGVYVRELSRELYPGDPAEGEDVPATRPDIEKAAQTLGRLQRIDGVVAEEVEQDLRGAWLSRADLSGLEFGGAKLEGANLQEANFWGVNLQEAELGWANLQKANLWEANLQKANLRRANLQEARLWEANLQEANLWEANLQEANLWEANLQEANLRGAILHTTNLSRCHMVHTHLRSVDRTDTVGLTQDQVNASFGVRAGFGRVTLPEGLSTPDHWHVAEAAEEDSGDLRQAYYAAYAVWRAAEGAG